MQDLTIYVDESGNLGRGEGRYFAKRLKIIILKKFGRGAK